MNDPAGLPQHLSFVTLGTRDMTRARAFYRAWGWREIDGGSDEFAQFDMGSTRFALFPLDLLTEEAAPGEPLPPLGWHGMTLAVNVPSHAEVDSAYRAALAAGAASIAAPVEREWGGWSAYVADHDGQRWEIAWLPGFHLPGADNDLGSTDPS